jgi:hypothetical protein
LGDPVEGWAVWAGRELMVDKPEQQPPDREEAKTPDFKWVGYENLLIQFSNAFAANFVQNEFVITFGTFTPLILSRPLTPEEIGEIKTLDIHCFCRIGLTADRVVELIGVLQQALKQYTEAEIKN